MTKPIEQYTADELSAKIQAIKAERERTANALKRYEEELERRKQEVQLGIPAERKAYVDCCFLNCCGEVVSQPLDPNDMYDKPMFDMFDVFTSEASAKKHSEMLLTWRMALIASAKGNQIDITVLLPLMKKGWVAMDALGVWRWYQEEPDRGICEWKNYGVIPSECLSAFNLKPAENWEYSLMECGL